MAYIVNFADFWVKFIEGEVSLKLLLGSSDVNTREVRLSGPGGF